MADSHSTPLAPGSPQVGPSSGESYDDRLVSAISFWTTRCPTSHVPLRERLDTFGLQIAHARTGTRSRRSALVQRTRAYKQDAENVTVGSVLKLYQKTIDFLTERAMGAEKAFLDVWEAFRELVDQGIQVGPLLEAAVVKFRHPTEEGDDFLDDSDSDEPATPVEAFQIKDKLSRALEENRLKGMQLTESEGRCEKLRTQLVGFESQLDILQSDLHSALVEKEEMLKELEERSIVDENVAGGGTGKEESSHAVEVGGLKMEIRQKEEQIAQLVKVSGERKELISELRGKLDEAAVEMRKMALLHAQEKRKLEERPPVDVHNEVVERLRVLERLEFGKAQEETAGEETPSLEVLYHRRVKTQQDEITRLMNLLEGEEKASANYRDQFQQAQHSCESQKSLIEKLEEDLMKLQEEQRTTPSGEDGMASSSAFYSDEGESTHVAMGMASPSKKMLSVVVEQRNRFRSSLANSEEENADLRSRISKLDSQIRQLRDDNVKLYQKIRYIESYHHDESGQILHVREEPRQNETPGDVVISVAETPEKKYRSLYEERISAKITNPFDRFTKRERQEQWKKLHWTERVILRTTGSMLKTTSGRLFLFGYICLLHLLVFFVCLHLMMNR